MQEFEQIVKIAYWIVLGILFVILISRFFYYRKTQSQRSNLKEEKAVFKLLRYLSIVILPIFIYGLITFVFVLQKGNLFAPNWMKHTFLLLLGMILVTETFYNTKIIPKKLNRILNILFLSISSIIGIYLTNLYHSAKSHPSIEKSIVIELPFNGKWIATGAGASSLTNHHDRIASQKYAVDISKIGDNGKLFTGAGIDKEESYTFGEKIFSPVDGEVVFLVDTLPDTPIRERDKLAGNHVVIKFQDSLYVALAHLQKKSIVVKVGDQVKTKDFIGKVGLSGNTDFCHLHLHIQDRPIYDIENGKAYPIRFKKFKRKRFLFWRNMENEYLLSNDIIIN